MQELEKSREELSQLKSDLQEKVELVSLVACGPEFDNGG